ncbi:MAG: M20/M25/M40 family metallo-hydrolase [Pseudomonadales bacterium]|nr:M20/M25/M40 family metallo-hydrolase [Pseudomonadales bacterium]
MKFISSISTFTVFVTLSLSLIAAENVEPAISEDERKINTWLESQEANMLALLERITNINSGSLNKAGVDELAAIFSAEFRELGFSTSNLPGELIEMPSCPGSDYNIDVADHVLATKTGIGPKFLLIGHLDTVFPPGSPFQEFRREGDVMYGPGVADMHGGLVVMLFALKALQEFGELENKSISILLNSDEEIGSLSSRKYIEEQALGHDWGLVYESSGTNNLTRTRKGLGQARFVVNGIASHAGGAHEQGRSAIKELAYKIVEIENMTDYETGVTVNVGIVNGGEARNTVAPCAEALIDLRYPEPQQGMEARQQFENIADQVYSYPVDSGEITTEHWINLHRPPKIPTTESDYLLEKTRAIGRLLGQELGVTDSGGGTDGSLTQAVGLATLDSLGVAGTGAHSNREEARVSSLVERAQLSAVLIRRLAVE